MAVVTITFEDDPSGDLKVRIESDPPFPGPAVFKKGKRPKITKAQECGMAMMRAMSQDVDAAYQEGEK